MLASDLTGIGDNHAERLARLYGAEAPNLLGNAGGDELVKAEVQQAVQKEGALPTRGLLGTPQQPSVV